MLDLDSTEWDILRTAYGFAKNVPEMIRALGKNPGPNEWERVWSSLCHQGSVYSATYAAMPHIVDLALERPMERQFEFWNFVGAVAAGASTLPGAIPDGIRDDFHAALGRAAGPIRRLLESRTRGRSEVIYLLAALASVSGCRGEGRVIDYLDSNEMPGSCPVCSSELLVVIEGGAARLVLESDHSRSTPLPSIEVKFKRKAPPDRQDPAEVATWIPALAEAAGQPDLAAILGSLYGRGTCPECDAQFSVLREFARAASERPQ